MIRTPDLKLEEGLWRSGLRFVAGLDEAGRGALAGPVAVGAVLFPAHVRGLLQKLDGSNPFRSAKAAHSIRLRSWAIHDGILGEPFTNVTMYKRAGKHAGINTSPDCGW